MENNLDVKRINKSNTLFAVVPEQQYKAVYRVAHQAGVSMAAVIRMSIEIGLPHVEEALIKVGKR